MAVLDWLYQLLGGGGQSGEMAPSSADQSPSDTSGIVLPYLQDVLSGKIAAGGVENTYDPNRPFAANALDPRGIEQATNLATAFSGGGLGIRAFHGSPHLFAPEPGAPLGRFRWDKIGTGEGAQAYGYAPAYVAEQEAVARGYRDDLTKVDDLWGALNDFLTGNKGSYLPPEQIAAKLQGTPVSGLLEDPQAIKALRELLPTYDPGAAVTGTDLRNYRYLNDRVEALAPKGHMYEVDINAKPEDFLQWDKPLGEQPPNVSAALEPGMAPHLAPLTAGTAMRQAAESPYAAGLVFNKGRGPLPASPADVSRRLLDMGIPGNRYLDQGSRSAGEGSSNYAIWTPEIITILRRYGLLPPLTAGGLLAAPGQGEAAQP